MPHPDTFRLILTIISLALLPLMLKRPFYGLLSYLIIMMLRPGAFYPMLGNIRIEFTVAVIIMIVIAFSPGRMTRINFASEPIFKWLFLFLIVVSLSMLQALDFDTAWERWFEFMKVILFFIMIITLLDSEKDITVFLWVFVIVTFVIGYSAIYNYFQGEMVTSYGETRADYAVADEKGMGSGHVALANILLQAIPFVWFLGVKDKTGLSKLVGILIFVWCIFGVFIAGSRGGFVGLIALGIMMTLYSKNKMVMIAGSLLVIMIMFSFFGGSYKSYIFSVFNLFTSGDELSSSSRFIGLRHGFEMLVKRPLLGVGPGCYPIARRAWFGWALWSHNHYGQLAGDLGLAGLIVWFGFLYNYVKRSLLLKNLFEESVMKNVMIAVITTTVVRLVVGMGSHSLYIFIWYLVAGITIVSTRLYEEIQESEESHSQKLESEIAQT